MIKDVVVKEIVTHWDERGFFRELINKKDNDFFKPGIAQWSLSIMYPGVIKAWHIHKIQFDWWYVGNGVLKVALYDKREDSSTYGQLMEFMLGEGRPPGGENSAWSCSRLQVHFRSVSAFLFNFEFI